MIIKYKESFNRDLKKIKNKDVIAQISKKIIEIKSAAKFSDILNIIFIKGSHKYYRIRIGDYRIGLSLENDEITLIRVLDRKDIYKYFPG